MTRPPIPWDPQPGFEWYVAEEDAEWQPLEGIDVGSRECRYSTGVIGGVRTTCRRPAVATLMRGVRRRSRWAYCERHLYGRWIEDGRIVGWRLRRIES